MVLQIGQAQIPYRVTPSRGKRISLGFAAPEPVLVIRTPSGKLTSKERAFIEAKQAWLIRHYERLRQDWDKRQAFLDQLAKGTVPYLGHLHRLELSPGPRSWVQVQEGIIYIEAPLAAEAAARSAIIYNSLRTLAEVHLTRRTRELAAQTQSDIQQIRVKSQRSKWGSCSAKRNINLNWHLIFLPRALVDYLIIHELMHLREMNHSPRFWQWVETFCPDYRQADRALAGYHWLIGVFDAE